MALTQLESERACPTSRGSKRVTKSVFEKQERWAGLKERATLSFKLPMICWGGCTFWMWEGAPSSEMISPSTCGTSTVVVEEVVAWEASASSVEAGTSSGDDVDGSSGSSSSPSTPCSERQKACNQSKAQRGSNERQQGKLDRRGLKTQWRERQKSTAKQSLAQEPIWTQQKGIWNSDELLHSVGKATGWGKTETGNTKIKFRSG
jgi:hypothetical protein